MHLWWRWCWKRNRFSPSRRSSLIWQKLTPDHNVTTIILHCRHGTLCQKYSHFNIGIHSIMIITNLTKVLEILYVFLIQHIPYSKFKLCILIQCSAWWIESPISSTWPITCRFTPINIMFTIFTPLHNLSNIVLDYFSLYPSILQINLCDFHLGYFLIRFDKALYLCLRQETEALWSLEGLGLGPVPDVPVPFGHVRRWPGLDLCVLCPKHPWASAFPTNN